MTRLSRGRIASVQGPSRGIADACRPNVPLCPSPAAAKIREQAWSFAGQFRSANSRAAAVRPPGLAAVAPNRDAIRGSGRGVFRRLMLGSFSFSIRSNISKTRSRAAFCRSRTSGGTTLMSASMRCCGLPHPRSRTALVAATRAAAATSRGLCRLEHVASIGAFISFASTLFFIFVVFGPAGSGRQARGASAALRSNGRYRRRRPSIPTTRLRGSSSRERYRGVSA
jgi:hypothetical protein